MTGRKKQERPDKSCGRGRPPNAPAQQPYSDNRDEQAEGGIAGSQTNKNKANSFPQDSARQYMYEQFQPDPSLVSGRSDPHLVMGSSSGSVLEQRYGSSSRSEILHRKESSIRPRARRPRESDSNSPQDQPAQRVRYSGSGRLDSREATQNQTRERIETQEVGYAEESGTRSQSDRPSSFPSSLNHSSSRKVPSAFSPPPEPATLKDHADHLKNPQGTQNADQRDRSTGGSMAMASGSQRVGHDNMATYGGDSFVTHEQDDGWVTHSSYGPYSRRQMGPPFAEGPLVDGFSSRSNVNAPVLPKFGRKPVLLSDTLEPRSEIVAPTRPSQYPPQELPPKSHTDKLGDFQLDASNKRTYYLANHTLTIPKKGDPELSYSSYRYPKSWGLAKEAMIPIYCSEKQTTRSVQQTVVDEKTGKVLNFLPEAIEYRKEKRKEIRAEKRKETRTEHEEDLTRAELDETLVESNKLARGIVNKELHDATLRTGLFDDKGAVEDPWKDKGYDKGLHD
ncbi:hypothetical protein GLAREA_09291 [Glarea lozoyensis ATCC 20868]|uniref:Uncharacterized protein n=1 Tax=Glarea lozoyensis (strain ATCC 20868 / MF5171) TaxID=1116229 RepID=S3EG19_GLAL2|nr:uncharacterized protein GLAREA_09291 [Glarea lozoyensis ATCC 20868]EPE37128.1 hypothetical protein GLAREA_09291 [Glarea lozoyensis ATCC 20868]